MKLNTQKRARYIIRDLFAFSVIALVIDFRAAMLTKICSQT